jgi:hypothetical protein
VLFDEDAIHLPTRVKNLIDSLSFFYNFQCVNGSKGGAGACWSFPSENSVSSLDVYCAGFSIYAIYSLPDYFAKEVAMNAAANRSERLQIMLEADELSAIDDFRYKFRLPSRAAAVRELLKRGLAGQPTGAAEAGSRSQDFGVLGLSNGSRFKDGGDADPNV